MEFTITQKQRLAELGAEPDALSALFDSAAARDAAFRLAEQALAKQNRERLDELLSRKRLTDAQIMEDSLSRWLTGEMGFTRVSSPVIIPKAMLEKMTITEGEGLFEQVFGVGGGKYLRPMLAPNLYVIMDALHKLTGGPVRIFECGPCFRRETSGARHMNEFTMLNMVAFNDVPEGGQMDALWAFARGAMEAAGLKDYETAEVKSAVYGSTLDIVAGGVEVASGAFGPHPLDGNFGIFGTWAGIGFGIERLVMAKNGWGNIRRAGRSTVYLDGSRLNL